MFTPFLKGKTALVTGSLSGIGLGIARSLSAAGANIVLNGFAPDAEIQKLEKELTTANTAAKFIFADLTKPADTRQLVEKSIAHFGAVDILVNNAGMQHIDSVENFPEDIWEKVISLNLSSAFYGTRYALPPMKQRGWGRIINIASVHGLVASVNKSAYVAAKHGIVGFTKACALENARAGVTINAICPGFVLTPLIQKQIDIIRDKRGISNE
jgi:3-hydroxybutyrate dehydrogenase